MRNQKVQKNQNKTYAQKLIPVIIVAIILYTVVAIILQFCGQGEISPTLTTCYFSFWGVEIINLALIKHGKIRNNTEKKDIKAKLQNIISDEITESED